MLYVRKLKSTELSSTTAGATLQIWGSRSTRSIVFYKTFNLNLKQTNKELDCKIPCTNTQIITNNYVYFSLAHKSKALQGACNMQPLLRL